MEKWVQPLLGSCIRVGTGTGFLLEHGAGVRVVLTAEHVVRDKEVIGASWSGGKAALRVLHRDGERDLAVLEEPIGLAAKTALRLASVAPPPGSPLAFAGYPQGWSDLVAVLQRGWVAAAGADELWFDGSANPGNSGGPVIDGDGAVIGVVLGRAGEVDKSLRAFADAAAKLRAQAERVSGPVKIGGDDGRIVDPLKETLLLTTGGMLDLANLMDRHFRTGLVRGAAVSRIQHVLGIP